MFDLNEYYRAENKLEFDSWQTTVDRIREIHDETERFHDNVDFGILFQRISRIILDMSTVEKNLNEAYFLNNDLKTLVAQNQKLFYEIVSPAYEKSYANPAFCVHIFGEPLGQLMSFFYFIYRQYSRFACFHYIFKMAGYNRLFISVYENVREGNLDYEYLKRLITDEVRENTVKTAAVAFKKRFDLNYRYFLDIVEHADLSDPRYLFRCGCYVSEHTLRLVRFLSTYDSVKLEKLARVIVTAYENSFPRTGKELQSGSLVKISYQLGQEMIIRYVVRELRSKGLEPLIDRVAAALPNRQYYYDHQNDHTLYLDHRYAEVRLRSLKNAYEQSAHYLQQYSGDISFVTGDFGSTPFVPLIKDQALKLNARQREMHKVYVKTSRSLYLSHVPRKQISFTAISFPSPEIGENFERIFNDVFEVNTQDEEKFALVQKTIIDALDLGRAIHIKGNNGNQTDLTIALPPLLSPEKETNFVNCLADVNIPVGEVFTTPQLKGTNGILHLEETYVLGYKFIDLTLTFEDGYLVDFRTTTFNKESDNLNYIDEHLLFHHDHLPIGEFAIGTNTLAYVMARKHKILQFLPMLISEKMGPHFALGDSCFSHQEDQRVFNPVDNKEVIAKENEKSALRKSYPSEAYTNFHLDINLPYESIGHIQVMTKAGPNIDIIRNGKFALPGTEFLNDPFLDAGAE
ncbi:aminopeptidase [candidate division CSSED10-310 bacterium]|uniref:Aminopeptidase n=1 Tax=candidate division CSSED10-310 bacterium TaxID=2855610 RepID=A0ABV6Z329_UNCC1